MRVDVISMPVVAATDSVEKALNRMTERGRVAVVVRGNTGLSLVKYSELSDKLTAAGGSIENIAGAPVKRITPQDFARHHVDTLQIASLPSSFFEAIRDELPGTIDYAGIDVVSESALLVPRDARFVTFLRGGPHYSCDGPVVHRFPATPPNVGSPCPMLGCPGTIDYAP